MASKRQKAPLWPPARHAAYQNLSSSEELPLQDTPQLDTPGTGMSGQHRSLLTPGLSPSPYNTPGLDSKHGTPYVGDSPQDLKYDSENQRKKWFGYGWRGGARIAFGGAFMVLIVNITLIAFMTIRYPKMDGFPVIFRGACEDAEKLNTIWHFVINILSTGLLAASNYCMQLLSAPTRSNVDQAHSQGKWLDIGIPSIRNLRFLNWKRTGLWVLLCISSLPLHLVYNSTFYAAIATNDYNILYATQDFVNGSAYDTVQFPDTAWQNISGIQANVSRWTYLRNEDCIKTYGHYYVTLYKNVVLVVSNTTSGNTSVANGSSLLHVGAQVMPEREELDKDYDPFHWICDDPQTNNRTRAARGDDSDDYMDKPPHCAAMSGALATIANSWWKSDGYSIHHCMAEEIENPDCHLHFAPQLMGPVILMNIIKCIVAFYVAFRYVDSPLVTMGDAIESFIKHPDPTTGGMCMITAQDAQHRFSRSAGGRVSTMRAPMPFDGKRRRWYTVVTKRQWLLLAVLLSAMVIGLVAGIFFGTKDLTPPTLRNAWSIGFGQVQTQNLLLGINLPQLGASTILITALVANSPQLLLSFMYMVYNTIFTLLYLGEDWDMYGAWTSTTRRELLRHKSRETHRYLRVSNPKGRQKSTHMLNLPLRFAVPLLCFSGFLHWLMSQSFYLANVSKILRDNSRQHVDEITTVAYAPRGMILLCGLVLLMILIVVLAGLRRFGGQMTVVASNSAAISAACHVGTMSERRRREIVLRRVAWGELPALEDSVAQRTPSFHMGLGIESDTGAKGAIYSANDFSDDMNANDDFDVHDGDKYGYKPVQGNVEMERLDDGESIGKSSAVGHCSFSDGFVGRLQVGKMYA